MFKTKILEHILDRFFHLRKNNSSLIATWYFLEETEGGVEISPCDYELFRYNSMGELYHRIPNRHRGRPPSTRMIKKEIMDEGRILLDPEFEMMFSLYKIDVEVFHLNSEHREMVCVWENRKKKVKELGQNIEFLEKL